ncbi:MAG: PQQ-binding-like beta-propeller repeat protein, partial [Opitutales bacterium]
MTGYLKAWSALIALTLGGLACVARVEAAEAKDPETVFEEADNAFVEGNFTLGEQLLNELIASHPGNLELATRALHRICLSEYLELMDNDWPSTGYPQHLFNVSGRDYDKMWELISEYLQEGFLIAGKFAEDGEQYHVDPRKNPFLLESLWRIVTNFPLSPLENISDEAPVRIMALRRSGYLDANDPAVIDASTLLVFLRPSQKRYLEAAQLVDDLVTAKNQQIDWLLARARFHATIRSPRAATLFRDLFVKFEKQGVDPIIAKAARRAEFFNIPDIGPATELAHAGQGWVGQLIHEEENRAWGRLATGLVDGLEEQIDLWIQGTFGNEQSQVYMLRKDETGSAMKWNVLDVQLKSLGAGALLELRKLQEERCRIDPRTSDWDKTTQTEKLVLFRRFPWSKTAHRGLMAYAKKELEAGRSQSARRGFRDVLEHTDDPDLHNRAQVGIWLATAQGQDYGELAKLFGAADQDDTFPWMGKRATAREIKERLMQGVVLPPAKNEAPPLSDLGVQFLKLPARPLWPQMKHRRSPGLEFVDLQSVGSNLLVSTRNLLAWYEAKNGNEPVWADTCRSGQGSSIGRLGRFRPIIKEDRIYTRWGYGADPGKLVAMDAGTRDILWSLDVTGPAKARRRIPLGNPVLSGDQIYLAAAWDEHRSTGGYNLRLSSVDAATGKVNWLTDLYIQAMQHFFEGVLGESLTIHDGAIYCSPSTGFLGRFDARDGKMEWMYNYESVDRTHLPVDTLGTAPHIVGDVVVGLPRDTNVMVGLDQRTGEVLWRSSLLLPTEIIGSVEGKVVVRGLYALAAIDAKTGEIQWRISHPDKILGQPTLQGSSIYLTSGDNLYRYDAATGIEQETRSLPKAKNTIRNAKTLHDNLYLITDEPSVEKEYSLVQKAPGDSVWEIMARDPKLYVPKGNESSQGEILIHADEMLHCLETTPAGKVL